MIETDYVTKMNISNYNKESFRFQTSPEQQVNIENLEEKKLNKILGTTAATNNEIDDLSSEYSTSSTKSSDSSHNSNISSSSSSRSGYSSTSSNNSDTTATTTTTTTTVFNRARGNWKKIKEISKKEEKRPPWQPVSLSTLPKPDKETLMKVKLLDASRRMRKNGVASQTDFVPTIIMKDATNDIQNDLIWKNDAEVLTDGRLIFRNDKPGQFFLTMTTILQTDKIPMENCATQTPTIRNLNINFNEFCKEFYNNNHEKLYNFKSNNEKIHNQLKRIKDSGKKLLLNGKNITILKDNSIKNYSEKELNTIQNKMIPLKFHKIIKNFTHSYWSFSIFDHIYLNNIENYKIFPLKSKINMNFPTKSNTLIQQYHENCLKNYSTPSTSTQSPSPPICDVMIPWNNLQRNAILILLKEAISLNKLFEEIALKIGPTLRRERIQRKKFIMPEFLSDKFQPQIEKAEKEIKILKSSLRKYDSSYSSSSSNNIEDIKIDELKNYSDDDDIDENYYNDAGKDLNNSISDTDVSEIE